MLTVCYIDNEIFISDKKKKKTAVFNRITGEKIAGTLNIQADKVLHMARKVTQLKYKKSNEQNH